MKRIAKILALTSLIALPLLSVVPNPVQLNVIWQDTNVDQFPFFLPGTNSCYLLKGTTVLGTPVASWPTVATFTNWTLGPNSWYTNQISVTPGNWFFTLVGSNFWGLYPPSTVAQTGPASTSPVNLGISR